RVNEIRARSGGGGAGRRLLACPGSSHAGEVPADLAGARVRRLTATDAGGAPVLQARPRRRGDAERATHERERDEPQPGALPRMRAAAARHRIGSHGRTLVRPAGACRVPHARARSTTAATARGGTTECGTHRAPPQRVKRCGWAYYIPRQGSRPFALHRARWTTKSRRVVSERAALAGMPC